MTKKQLIEAIQHLPDNMDVFMGERLTTFTYGLVNSVIVKKIDFYEDENDDQPLASDEVIVLTED